ncbi:MAG: 16S rRNA (cytosine(967)-C(5))-methyltransferase RsmB [Nitrospirota bacterium]
MNRVRGITEKDRTYSSRQIALDALNMIEKGALASSVFEKVFECKPSRLDRAFIMELVYGVLRNRGKIDWIIECSAGRRLKEIEIGVVNILRSGIYQLLFMDKVPTWAAVDESVKLAKRCKYKRASGFINGVLRRTSKISPDLLDFPRLEEGPLHHISVVYSHPEWLVKRWLGQFGVEDTIALCKTNNRIPPLTLRTNTLLTNRDELINDLSKEGVEAVNTPVSPVGIKVKGIISIEELPSFKRGWFQIQDEASQLISYLLFPKKGERILDACAAPGGKTTHIAQFIEDEGEIIAIDINEEKLIRLKENCKRLGIKCVKSYHTDSTKDLKWLGVFDRILLDAPCSGTGIIRRHPDGKWRKTERTITEYQALQKKLLENIAEILKPGGVIVYSTCSTEPEEGENVVNEFLHNHPKFYIDNPVTYIPATGRHLINYPSGDFIRTYPHISDMDGFFGARLVCH